MHAPLVTKSPGIVLYSEPQVTGSRWQMVSETWSGFVSAINAPKCQHVTRLPLANPRPGACVSPDFAEEPDTCVQLARSARLPAFKSSHRQLPLRVLNK